MAIPADFAARMRAGRAYADLSREDLADRLGMSAGYIKNVEGGKGLKPTEARALIEMLPEITGLPRAFFAGEDDDASSLDEHLSAIEEQIQLLRGETVTRVAEVLRRIDDIAQPTEAPRRRRRQ